ncbi:MAG: hypothetical protein RMY16_25060 [Nostoc sp. DedQUE12b]|uniref:hypothetical protein n=1 Tax=Nostoc sp. DedQUE12b TaxID=3075398 RepID=UPI002AD1E628|nr:hypothetical protein [Nostoc sp. DedQUE12b]MDZ8088795.1 hypothetical protein [Nostoc sp. DedQUE12b]
MLQYYFKPYTKSDTINFYKALRGEKLSSSIRDITFTTHYLGELILTSGRLVACDPLAFLDSEAFQKSLATGKYSVFLIVALLTLSLSFEY